MVFEMVSSVFPCSIHVTCKLLTPNNTQTQSSLLSKINVVFRCFTSTPLFAAPPDSKHHIMHSTHIIKPWAEGKRSAAQQPQESGLYSGAACLSVGAVIANKLNMSRCVCWHKAYVSKERSAHVLRSEPEPTDATRKQMLILRMRSLSKWEKQENWGNIDIG